MLPLKFWLLGRRSAPMVAALLGTLALAGCATTPQTIQMVWPDPPEKPRIKLVRSIRSRDDVAGPSLVEIVAGMEQRIALFQPMGLAISEDGNRLYVSDFALNAVLVFDFGGKQFRLIGDQERFPLFRPLGVALDAQENLYVTDLSLSVRVYDKTGRFLRSIGERDLVKPTGVAVDKARQRLYVVDTGHNDDRPAHRVKVFDLAGKLIQEVGRRGNGDGEFNFPTYAALDSQGRLYVVDSANFRIQVFDPEGKFLRKFGRAGNRPGHFSRPKGVALDGFDNIYVVDSTWSNVQIFDQEGELLLFFAGVGTTPGLLLNPATLAISKDNTIYVSDSYGRRVNVYQLINTTAEDGPKGPGAEAKGGEAGRSKKVKESGGQS